MKCENPKVHDHKVHPLDRGENLIQEIRIKKNHCIKYLFFPDQDGIYERRFIVEEGAVLRAAAIILGSNIVLKMSVFIEGSRGDARLELLGLARDGSNLEIHGIGKVSSGTTEVKLRVDQTNVLLGTGAKIRGMPVLEAETDSIEGGHSCRIHRISGDSLFYLESHGLSPENAESLLLEAEIMRHVSVMEEKADEVKGEILNRLIQ